MSSDRTTIDASLHWRYLGPQDDGWRQIRCLYAYLAPKSREILYIGKSWSVCVRDRWKRSGKPHFWDYLEKERGHREHSVILGEIALPPRKRLSHELLCDIESLLIWRLAPKGNIQSITSRTSRPDFTIACGGAWPSRTKTFQDKG